MYVMFVCGTAMVRVRFVTPSFQLVKTQFTEAVAEIMTFEPAWKLPPPKPVPAPGGLACTETVLISGTKVAI